MEYNPNNTWEFNLKENVRWGTENEEDDVCYFVKEKLEHIANEEGYILIKKDKNHE